MNANQAGGTRILSNWANAGGAPTTAAPLRGIRSLECAKGVWQLSGMVPPSALGLAEEHELGRGSTANSYLLYDPEDGFLTGSSPMFLVDVPEFRFKDEFIEQVQKQLSRLEGLVLTNLDVAQVPMVQALEQATSQVGGKSAKLKIFCTPPAVEIIRNNVESEADFERFDFQVVKEGDRVWMDPKKAKKAAAGPKPDEKAAVGSPQEQLQAFLLDTKKAPAGAPDADQRLRFVHTPTPRLPEAMCVFDERNGVLFSGKFFSAHNMVEDLTLDATWELFSEDWFHFFDCNFFSKYAQKALRKIEQISEVGSAECLEEDHCLLQQDIQALMPVHGPVVKSSAWRLMAKYETWLERKLSMDLEGSALLLHTSAYGNTKAMLDAVRKGVESSGMKSNLLNLEFCEAAEVLEALKECDGFALGTPTLGGHMPVQVKEAVGVMLQAAQSGGASGGGSVRSGGSASKPCGVFGSYGWSGEAVEEAYLRLKDGGYEFAFEPIRCKFTPDEKMLQTCEEAGARLAQEISNCKKKAQQMQMAKATKNVEKRDGSSIAAFGKLINASCVVTMKQGEEIVKLPVSWVSQASFVPPGVMMAVHTENLDNFLTMDVEEQMTELFKKYDADSSGQLDKEETMFMLDELLGTQPGSLDSELFAAQKEEAWALLDDDGSGEVDVGELAAAAKSGPLADMIAQQRRIASLETLLGKAENHVQFNLSMIAQGMSVADAMKADLVDPKGCKNGLPAIKGATSFVECTVDKAVQSGNCTLLYGLVEAGSVLDDSARTQLVNTNHIETAEAKEPAMA